MVYWKEESTKKKYTEDALPLSNHCLPDSLFSLGAERAESGINLNIQHCKFIRTILLKANDSMISRNVTTESTRMQHLILSIYFAKRLALVSVMH